jgi:hypothetical protein
LGICDRRASREASAHATAVARLEPGFVFSRCPAVTLQEEANVARSDARY